MGGGETLPEPDDPEDPPDDLIGSEPKDGFGSIERPGFTELTSRPVEPLLPWTLINGGGSLPV